MDYFIRRVTINGLFEKDNNYKIDLSEGCNCIYGGNGTGKTTIINLIVNSLNLELNSLAKTPFESITILLAKSGQLRAKKFFTLTRKLPEADNRFRTVNLKYSIDGEPKPHSFAVRPREDYERIEERYSVKIEHLKTLLHEKVNLTHVPLLRIHDSELLGLRDERDEFLHRSLRSRRVSPQHINEIMDPSIRVLSSLQKQFIAEAGKTTKTITEKLETLKSQIIEKVMIDSSLIKQVSKAFSKVSKAIKDEVEDVDVAAYIAKLNEAKIDVPEKKIYEHFQTWKELNDSVKTNFETLQRHENTKISDKKRAENTEKFNTSYFSLFAMSHFHDRFLSIVDDVESMQEEKSELTKSFRDYEHEVNSYLNNKKRFILNDDGKFSVYSDKRKIQLTELSSGEKHILTILGRAALSSDEGAIFVADEPELSLHLDWQRMILPSIINLSPKSQIIVATHSPSIHAPQATEIDLEECM